MTTTTRAPLTHTSIGVAEHTADRQRYGLIHRPDSSRVTVGTQRRQAYRIFCGPPIKSARAIQFANSDTSADDWCEDCWEKSAATCDTGIRTGPFSPLGRRATPICADHGDLTPSHVDRETAREIADRHLRAGGAS